MEAERCRVDAGLAVVSVAILLADSALRRGVHRCFNDSTVLDDVPVMGKAQLRAGLPSNMMMYPARELLKPAYRTRVRCAAILTPSVAVSYTPLYCCFLAPAPGSDLLLPSSQRPTK